MKEFDEKDYRVEYILDTNDIVEIEELADFLLDHYMATEQELYCNVCGNNNVDQAMTLVDQEIYDITWSDQ